MSQYFVNTKSKILVFYNQECINSQEISVCTLALIQIGFRIVLFCLNFEVVEDIVRM